MRFFNEFEAKKFLKKYGVNVTEECLVKQEEDAVKAASKIGFPVVMKVISDKLIHKTESKGVVLNVKSEEEARTAYNDLYKIAERVDDEFKGIAVERMVPGHQLIIGIKRDAQFGYVLMFGLGGIFVEIFKDVSFRIIPLDKDEIFEMIRETKSFEILNGARGHEKIDFDKLVDVIFKISLIVKEDVSVEELDINPLIVNKKEAIVADARIILN